MYPFYIKMELLPSLKEETRLRHLKDFLKNER